MPTITVQFGPLIAVDPNTGLPTTTLRGQSGQIVLKGTTTVVPVYEDQAKTLPIASSSLTITDNSFIGKFWADITAYDPSGYQFDWYDGTNRVGVWSPEGLLAAALAAASAAEGAAAAASSAVASEFADQTAAAQAAQAAAESAAAVATAAGAALPDGGTPNVDILWRGPTSRTGIWAPAPTGGGSGVVDWNVSGSILNKPSVFPPADHTQLIASISDVTAFGRGIVKAADAAAVRTLIAAAPNTVVSWPGNGTSAGQTAPGNHTHDPSTIPFTPPSGSALTASNMFDAVVQAAALGGTVVSDTLNVTYASGAYPTQPVTAPTGVKFRIFRGPVQYTGATWSGVIDEYRYVALT